MVQFFRGGPSRAQLQADILAPALGEGLGNMTSTYFANDSLDRVLNDKSYAKKPLSERWAALQRAGAPYGEKGQKLLQQRLGIEQQYEQEKQQSQEKRQQGILAKALRNEPISPEEEQQLSPEYQFKKAEIDRKRTGDQQVKALGKQINQSLVKAGYPTETAELWQKQFEAAPVGGQTDVIKQVNDLIKRSKLGKGDLFENDKPVLKPSIDIPGIESKSFELDFPDLKEGVGRNPADVIKEEEGNRKINAPLYGETIDSLNALEEDFRDISQLQEYNDTPGALPEGIQKWNVDWNTGDLRFKALATPETQGYVKIIARLLGRAKEYFPGRVTNFDLEQFKTRFPTLANSPEGRKLISEQLYVANRIAFLKDETMKAAIDHYGAGADPTQVRRYSQENYRKLKGQLESELKGLDSQADKLEKTNSQKPFTPDVALKFLEQSQGNRQEAERLAREAGYEF